MLIGEKETERENTYFDELLYDVAPSDSSDRSSDEEEGKDGLYE